MAKMTDEEFKNKAAELLNAGKEKPAEPTKEQLDKVQVIDLAANTLTGDIRDFLLDRVKNLGKPWAAMTEDEQHDQIHAAKEAAERLVKLCCEIIASGGKKSMIGTLVKVAVKDKIQVQIDFNRHDEQRHELMDATSLTVAVVLTDAEIYTGERAPAEATPMQGSLLDNAEKLKKGKDKVTPIKRL